MKLNWSWIGATCILAGILILVLPNIIEYLIGIGLIVVGILYFTVKTLGQIGFAADIPHGYDDGS